MEIDILKGDKFKFNLAMCLTNILPACWIKPKCGFHTV